MCSIIYLIYLFTYIYLYLSIYLFNHLFIYFLILFIYLQIVVFVCTFGFKLEVEAQESNFDGLTTQPLADIEQRWGVVRLCLMHHLHVPLIFASSNKYIGWLRTHIIHYNTIICLHTHVHINLNTLLINFYHQPMSTNALLPDDSDDCSIHLCC
jgi:hypothetical protein